MLHAPLGWIRRSVLALIAGGLMSHFLARAAEAAATGPDTDKQIARGKLLYIQSCIVCHQANGQGTPGTFPPLAAWARAPRWQASQLTPSVTA